MYDKLFEQSKNHYEIKETISDEEGNKTIIYNYDYRVGLFYPKKIELDFISASEYVNPIDIEIGI